jgi:hypothetical protein
MIPRSVEKTNQINPIKTNGTVYRKVRTSPVPTSLRWVLIVSNPGQKALAKLESRLYFSGKGEFRNEVISVSDNENK